MPRHSWLSPGESPLGGHQCRRPWDGCVALFSPLIGCAGWSKACLPGEGCEDPCDQCFWLLAGYSSRESCPITSRTGFSSGSATCTSRFPSELLSHRLQLSRAGHEQYFLARQGWAVGHPLLLRMPHWLNVLGWLPGSLPTWHAACLWVPLLGAGNIRWWWSAVCTAGKRG